MEMTRTLPQDILTDIDAIQAIPLVPVMLEVICRTTGMGFAAIARVTEESWVACCVRDEISFGLQAGGELQLETTICNEIRQHHQTVVIDEVATDPAFATHHTSLQYGFQSYISVPIKRKDGSFFGTLCAIDPKPAKLKNPLVIGMFELYTELLSFHLSAVEDLKTSERSLSEATQLSELREHFIAVLGHDLRTPLTSVQASAALLSKTVKDTTEKRLIGIIHKGARRMNELVGHIMDFAHAKLGSGINLNLEQNNGLEHVLYEVIAELQLVWPGRAIEANFDLKVPVVCDNNRVGQLFSNLLSNALTYGKPDHAVTVYAKSSVGNFELSVTNAGDEIPGHLLGNLFQPFSRGKQDSNKEGLGLGLYIAHEIAMAHRGKLSVVSAPGSTTFTLQI